MSGRKTNAERQAAFKPARRAILIQLLSAVGVIAIGASAWLFAPPGTFVLSCAFGWTLLALAVVDLKRYILPDPLNLLVALLGVVMVALTRPHAWLEHLIGGVAGFTVLLSVELYYRHFKGRNGLGRGDAKLLGAIGIWVGWTRLPDILIIAALSGLIAVLTVAMASRKAIDGGQPIAFGPWLALAGWIAWLSGPILVSAV